MNIDAPVLAEAKRIHAREGKSLGEVISELMAEALDRRRRGDEPSAPLRWTAKAMGERVDLRDKEALYAALDRPYETSRPWSEVAERPAESSETNGGSDP